MRHLLLAIIVSVSVDSTTLFIGDQTDMHLQVTHDKQEVVQMPIYGETLMPGIEIVDRTIVDTTYLANDQVQLNQYLTLTSFADSLFYISPIPFVNGDDTIFSEGISLNVVQPFEMDSADMAITDIKDIYKAKIWWWGIIRWILLALLCIGLGIGIYYLARYIAQHKKGEEITKPSEPQRPAEEIALEALDQIKREKIWQSGQTKQYHTQLTDVIRTYIAQRYDFSSNEKTSDEILREMHIRLQDNRDLYNQLRKMLQLADLVKFAKWATTPDENELSLRIAYDFVHQTTPVANEELQDNA
ncbi:MAG: hypothetical protein IIW05_05700 [Paludibacteraceae bacterium]|jgi:hypothetical protein|nr:hypothetical protein [Paludibacteraceae bacterium]